MRTETASQQLAAQLEASPPPALPPASSLPPAGQLALEVAQMQGSLGTPQPALAVPPPPQPQRSRVRTQSPREALPRYLSAAWVTARLAAEAAEAAEAGAAAAS